MGAGSGAGSKERRKKAKKAVKAAEKARYKAMVEASMNSKPKGQGREGADRLVADHKHETSFCGNVGCKRCFPVLHAKMAEELQASRKAKPLGKPKPGKSHNDLTA